jgi:aspartyl protease family protein
MLKFLAVAAFGALSAMGAAQAVGALDRGAHRPELRPAAQASDTLPEAPIAAAAVSSASGGPASVSKGPDGHYWAQAQVNGRYVRFLVDTGATTVALTSQDAERLGLNPRQLDYTSAVITANGQARAARVKLDSITVAGARVEEVDALVIEKGLQTSLLGMTYLGRLSRFEATPTALILRP